MVYWIILFFAFGIAVMMYLIILGANINKSDLEKINDDDEQIRYLKDYKKERKLRKIFKKMFIFVKKWIS